MATSLGDRYAVMLDGVTTTTTKTAVCGAGRALGFIAKVSGTGAVTATVVIRGGFDGTTFVDVATFSLSGTDSVVEGLVETNWCWSQVQVALTAVSGTGAAVTVQMGG